MVERAKERIRRDDIFQVMLFNRLKAEMAGSWTFTECYTLSC